MVVALRSLDICEARSAVEVSMAATTHQDGTRNVPQVPLERGKAIKEVQEGMQKAIQNYKRELQAAAADAEAARAARETGAGIAAAEGAPAAPVELIQEAEEEAVTRLAERRFEAERALDNAIDEAIKRLYPYSPREGQRYALRKLLGDQTDLILIAKTSFGKSMILQAATILVKDATALIILPLNQIGEEQTAFIKSLGGKPFFLNAESLKDGGEKLLEELRSGHFTHILTSPELAIGRQFHSVATSPAFKERLSLVAIDEAHLVGMWGKEFRKDYSRLASLRRLIGPGVPWFACSATLDRQGLVELREGAGFGDQTEIYRTSINRPELALRLGKIPEGTYGNFTSLRFLFDQAVQPDIRYNPKEKIDHKLRGQRLITPHRIPKTIIFFDSRKDAHNAADKLRAYLSSLSTGYTHQLLLDIIKVYHRCTADLDKRSIINELNKPGEESAIRVLCATEAVGHGVNIRDFRRVVQYKLPPNCHLSGLWQRGGRGCRDGEEGEMILLVEEWAIGDRTYPRSKVRPDLSQISASTSTATGSEDTAQDAGTQKKLRKDNLERRDALADEVYDLINGSHCLQEIFLDFLQEPDSFRSETNTARCCCRCNPNILALHDIERFLTTETKPAVRNRFQKRALSRLEAWADGIVKDICPPDMIIGCERQLIISPKLLKSIAANFDSINNVEELREVAGKWALFDKYAGQILQIVQDVYLYVPRTCSPRENDTPAPGGAAWTQPSTTAHSSQAQPESSSQVDIPNPPILVQRREPLQTISGNTKRRHPDVDSRTKRQG